MVRRKRFRLLLVDVHARQVHVGEVLRLPRGLQQTSGTVIHMVVSFVPVGLRILSEMGVRHVCDRVYVCFCGT